MLQCLSQSENVINASTTRSETSLFFSYLVLSVFLKSPHYETREYLGSYRDKADASVVVTRCSGTFLEDGNDC
jgi:hypothetical protein